LDTEIVKNTGERPVRPEKLVWMEERTPSSQDEERSKARGLREASDNSFMDCVIPSCEWKRHARIKLMSDYVSQTLEAFAVLVYSNGFEKWNEEFPVSEDEGTEASSLTSGSRGNCRFRYTSDSKGSRKYEGWSPDGMKLYNEVLVLVGNLRRLPDCTFEQRLLKTLAGKPRGGRRHGDAATAPRVSNNSNALMNIVGI
jgi:hypothetical protein